MTSVRDLRPTDIVAFAAFEAKASPNLARTRERLQQESRGPLSLNALIEPWLPTEPRRTIVAAEGLAHEGLWSANALAERTGGSMSRVLPEASQSGSLSLRY